MPTDVVEWAERNLTLEVADLPGRLRLFPYQKQPLRDIVDPSVNEVDMMWASQLGKTQVDSVSLLYVMSETPTSVMFMHASGDGLKKFIREKLEPTLKANPDINRLLVRNNRGSLPEDGFEFEGGYCTMTTPRKRSGKHGSSAARVYGDEIDDYDSPTAVSSLTQRTITYRDATLVLSSTPTMAGSSPIESRFEMGSQSFWMAVCPHCRFPQVLEWANVVGASLCCTQCGVLWSELDRLRAISDGFWEDQNPDADPGHRSYWLSQLYSPMVPLARTVEEAKKYTDQEVSTQILAWPYEERVLPEITPDQVQRRELDFDPAYRTVGVDVQGNRLEYCVLLFDRTLKRKHMVCHLQIPRQPGTGHFYVLRQDNPRFNWLSVDGGFDYEHVEHGLWAAWQDRYYLENPLLEIVRGYPAASFEKPIRGARGGGGAFRWLAVDEAKVLVAQDIMSGDLTIAPDCPVHTPAQLTAEKLVRTTSPTGKVRREWRKKNPRAANEALDCTVYAYAGALGAYALDTTPLPKPVISSGLADHLEGPHTEQPWRG